MIFLQSHISNNIGIFSPDMYEMLLTRTFSLRIRKNRKKFQKLNSASQGVLQAGLAIT